MIKRIGHLVAILGMLFLSACGGGEPVSSNPGIPDSELDQVRSDPRVTRLGSILERADTLLVASFPARISISVQGQTTTERVAESLSCTGSRCVWDDSGEVFDLADLADPATDTSVIVTRADLRSQAGFDTITFSANAPDSTSTTVPGVTITSSLSADHYGAWGEYGAAFLSNIDAPVSGQAHGIPFTGNITGALPYILGDATGTNPTGLGSATWTGIAEAASTRTFQRRQGTATLTIADLSSPRVGVAIDVAGYAIGSPDWSDMPLANGGFATGSIGSDYLEGNFHGPNHDEAYGVFDTGTYVGAFGTKRTQ